MEWFWDALIHIERCFFFIIPITFVLTILLLRHFRLQIQDIIRLEVLVIFAVTMWLWRLGFSTATGRYMLPTAMLFCLPAAFGIPWLISLLCQWIRMNHLAWRNRVECFLLVLMCVALTTISASKTVPLFRETRPILKLADALNESCSPGAVVIDVSRDGIRVARWLSDHIQLISLDKTFEEYGTTLRLWDCITNYTTMEGQDVWILAKQDKKRKDIQLKHELEGLSPIFPFQECRRFPYRHQVYLLLRFTNQTEFEHHNEPEHPLTQETVLASQMEKNIRTLNLSEILPPKKNILMDWENKSGGKLQMSDNQLTFVPHGQFSGVLRTANLLLWPKQTYELAAEEKMDDLNHYAVRLTQQVAGRQGKLAQGELPLWWPDRLFRYDENDSFYTWSSNPLAAVSNPELELSSTMDESKLIIALRSLDNRLWGETECIVETMAKELPKKLKTGCFLLCRDPEYREIGSQLEDELRKRGSEIQIEEIVLTLQGATKLPEDLLPELDGLLSEKEYDGIILNVGASELLRYGRRWAGASTSRESAEQIRIALHKLCKKHPRTMIALVMPPAPAPGETEKDMFRFMEWFRLGLMHMSLCKNWWAMQSPTWTVIAVHPYLSQDDYEEGTLTKYRKPFMLNDSGAEHTARAIVNGLFAAEH